MDVLEKAEKIREKTGVTYEEAKAALEAADGDILDALVYLERRGKIREPEVSVYTTEASEDTSEEFRQAARNFEDAEKETFGDHVRRFLKWCGRMIEKGCENFFIVEKKGEEMITMPVLVLILLLCFAFWAVVPLMVAGLFFGFRYHFKGAITRSVDVNYACDKAAEAAETIRQEFSRQDAQESREKETGEK